MAVQNELAYLPATEIAARIARRDVSPVEVVDYFLDRIDRDNHTVNAYVLVLHEEAAARARSREGRGFRSDARTTARRPDRDQGPVRLQGGSSPHHRVQAAQE